MTEQRPAEEYDFGGLGTSYMINSLHNAIYGPYVQHHLEAAGHGNWPLALFQELQRRKALPDDLFTAFVARQMGINHG